MKVEMRTALLLDPEREWEQRAAGAGVVTEAVLRPYRRNAAPLPSVGREWRLGKPRSSLQGREGQRQQDRQLSPRLLPLHGRRGMIPA